MRGAAVKVGLVAAVLLALGLAYAYGGRFLGTDAERGVAVTGTVEATQVDVSPRIAGRIVELRVKEGDRVTRGQVLARLDDEELTAEVRRQEAGLRTAQSTLRDLEAGARREEIEAARAAVAQVQARLDDLLAGSRPQEIEDARAAVRSAEATQGWTERDYLKIVRGIVLKGVGFEVLWPSLVPLLLFGVAVFTLAVLKFRKTLD